MKSIFLTGQVIGRSVQKVASNGRERLLLLLLAVAAVPICACGTDSPTSNAPSTPPKAARGGELIASLRSEPATYNRYLPNGGGAAVELVTLLTQARLVRVNRVTDELEPWVAEKWNAAADGVTYTITLRDGVKFSDGHPLTTDDVLFSLRVAYDTSVQSVLAVALQVNGKPLQASAVDARTLTIRLPEPFAPGLRLLENLPVLP